MLIRKISTRILTGLFLLIFISLSIPPHAVTATFDNPQPIRHSELRSASTGTGTTAPPYKTEDTWTNELALGWADAYANHNTGFISINAFSYAGGASAQADQFIDVTIPGGQLSEVTVVASIIYAGGTEKIGIGASAWGGVDKMWYVGNQEHRESLDAVFGWDDIGSAAVDLAMTLAPGGVELAGLSETSSIAKIVDTIGNINDAYTIASGFNNLLNAGQAQRTNIAFSFQASSTTQVGVGLRADTSGCILGACNSTILGYVDHIYVYINPVIADGYWSFNTWTGSGNISDDSPPADDASANGVTSISSGRSSKGISFDGTNDWVELGFDSAERTVLTNQGTLELWVKPELTTDAMLIYGGNGSSADGWGPEKELHLATDGLGRFNFSLSSINDNTFYKSVSFGSYTQNVWYHVAVTYQNTPNGSINCYINGQRVQPVASYCSNSLLTAHLTLDRINLGKPNANSRYYKGQMDEVRVYSRILSDKEIKANCWQGIDLTAPTVPVMEPEPSYSPSLENMIACSTAVDSESGVWQYHFQCLNGENVVLQEGTWTASPRYTFQNLTDGTTYFYRVQAKDAMGNVSGWSSAVYSTQDNTVPAVTPFYPVFTAAGQVQNNQIFFDLPLETSDAGGITSIYTGYTVQTEYNMTTPYPTSISSLRVSIPLADGPYYTDGDGWRIDGQVNDVVGNWTYFLMDGIKIDYQNPQGSITINNNDQFTNSQTVTLSLSSSHPGWGFSVPNMRLSNDGSNWNNWENNAVTKSWQLSAGYGNKTVYAQFKDAAGHISGTYQDYIAYGPTPSGAILINNDAVWTTSRNVNLSLTGNNAFEMNVWEGNPAATPSSAVSPPSVGWEPYGTSKAFVLGTTGDGQKVVYVRYRNVTYQQSVSYYDTINLDTVAPSGSFSINGGAASTNSTAVTLALSMTDSTSGLSVMRFDNGENSWTGWESYQTGKDWELLPGEGLKTVRAQIRDVAGNIFQISQNINVDLCPPAGTISIDSGDQYTGSTSVELNASIIGQTYSLPEQFSSTQGFMGWRYYRSPEPGVYEELKWDNIVSPDKNPKAYYSWNSKVGDDDIKDLQITGPDHGNTLQTGDTVFDGPGNIAIGWEAGDRVRTVNITAELWAASPVIPGDEKSNPGDGVYFSIFNGSSQINEKIQVIQSEKANYCRVELNNISVAKGALIYFYIDRGLSSVNDLVKYRFLITDVIETGPCQVRLANLLPDNIDPTKVVTEANWWQALQNVPWSSWQVCDPNYYNSSWAIQSGDGLKTIMAQFKDGVGNESHPFRTNIILDQTVPPVGSITINGGALETSVAAVTLDLWATDATSGIAEMQISENGSTGSWEGYKTQKPWTLSEAGERTLSVIYKDAAGNTSGTSNATILYNPLFTGANPGRGLFSNAQLADVNSDGWTDLLAVSARSASNLGLFINQGDGTFEPSLTAFPAPITGVYRVLPADLDNDGSLDLVVIPKETLSGAPVRILMNNGSGEFTENQQISDLSTFYEAVLGDLDNDGDQDLVLSGTGETGRPPVPVPQVKIYNNSGGTFSAGFGSDETINIKATSMALGDINGDGQVELLLGRSSASLVFDASGRVTIRIIGKPNGEWQSIGQLQSSDTSVTASGRFPLVLLDMDGDRDLDLISGGSKTIVWTNDGTGTLEEPSLGRYPFRNVVANQIIPVDINNDGELDLVIGEASGSFNRINIGLSWGKLDSSNQQLYPIRYECLSSGAVGDVNRDNKPDIILGMLTGFPSSYYSDMPSSLVLLNTGGINALPAAPGRPSASANGGVITFTWDPAVSTEFLTYNLRVGLTPGGNEIFSGILPPAFGNAGPQLNHVLNLSDGTYYWSVQSVDGGFARSAWTDEQELTIDSQAPSGFGCSTPNNGATGVSISPSLVSISANDPNGPINYNFQIAENSAFNPVLQTSGWQTGTSWSPAALQGKKQYYWRVQARDALNNASAFCTAFSFFTPGTNSIISGAGAHGSISPSGNVTVNFGSDQSFNINADSGYHVAGVLVDNVSVGAVSSYKFTSVTADHTISASFAVNINTYSLTINSTGSGTVNRNPDQANYNSGTTVELTANPAEGWHFSQWDGDAEGSTNPLIVSMDSNKTISALFTKNTYTITANAGEYGSISPSGEIAANHGDDQSFNITADSGYHVANVQVDNASIGAVSSYKFTSVTADHTISASFAVNTNTYNLTINSTGSGTVNRNPDQANYNSGTTVELTASPAEGWHFSQWNGDAAGSTNPLIVSMDSNKTISATFIQNTFKITATAGENGSITPMGQVMTKWGDNQTFSIAANTDFHVADVLVDGTSVGPVTTYTFYNIRKDHTIAASFTIDTFTVLTNPDPEEGGSISVDPEGPSYDCGTKITLAAKSNPGFVFLGWSGDLEGNTNPITLSITDNLFVTAKFTSAPSSEVWNLPRQYSSTQGDNNWYYYGHQQSTGLNSLALLSFDNMVSPWGGRPFSDWNGGTNYEGSRFMEFVGRDLFNWQNIGSGGASGWLQPGEYGYNNFAIGWKAPQSGEVNIKGMLNTAYTDYAATGGWSGWSDNGVYFSIFKGTNQLAGPSLVFRGNNESNRIPEVTLNPKTTVNAGDMIYFYIDRGVWQDADGMFYSFSVSYDTNADLSPPLSGHSFATNYLTLSASDDESGVAVIEYSQYYPVSTDWKPYSKPIVLTPGTYSFMYRSLDNNGNVEPYHQITLNVTTPVPNDLKVDFSAEPLSGQAPLTVTFTDNSTSSEELVSWNWDFGDGNTSEEQNPVHIYSSKGEYTVTLKVQDSGEETGIKTKEAYIKISEASIGSFQRWYLDSSGYPNMEQSGIQKDSVQIDPGSSVMWLSDQKAGTDIVFSKGQWTIKLATSDWARHCSAQVGDFNPDGDGSFTPFNSDPATGSYSDGIITLKIDHASTVTQDHFLALKIMNSDRETSYSISTVGNSYLDSPDSDPPFPVPELSAFLLLLSGILGLVGFICIKRRYLGTRDIRV